MWKDNQTSSSSSDGQLDHYFFQPIQRANSTQGGGPWLQKPLDVTLAEIDRSTHTLAENSGPEINRSNSYYNQDRVSHNNGGDDRSSKQNDDFIERHLTLFDLVSIGVG